MSTDIRYQYKTAYSPLYECDVEILNVRADDDGNLIYTARLEGKEFHVVFCEHELTKFCL